MTDKYDDIKHLLSDYISRRFGYKRPIIHFGVSKNTMRIDYKKVDLYLRFFEGLPLRKEPTIVIARMFFDEQKAGHGTDFLQFITKLASECKYRFIELECCNENARAFALTFGFEFLDTMGQNCRIAVSELLGRFGKDHLAVSES